MRALSLKISRLTNRLLFQPLQSGHQFTCSKPDISTPSFFVRFCDFWLSLDQKLALPT